MVDDQEILERLFVACWRDERIKRSFVSDARAVMRTFGLDVPDDLQVRVLENRADLVHIVMPRAPVEEHDVTDAELGLPTSGDNDHTLHFARTLVYLRASLDG